METIYVHGAPGEYVLQKGVLNQLEDKLVERGLQKALIVHGQKSWKAASPFWPTLTKIQTTEYIYNGENSITEIETVARLASEGGFETIIGVGGGKVLDLAKSAGHLTHMPVILIPTLSSNCSPWTPVSVIYDDSGKFLRFDVYPVAASLVLVEPLILLQGPFDMLIAGIADTLAKWYEADVQMAAMEDKSVPLEICYYTAKQCKDVLLKHSEGAVIAAKTGILNNDFIKVAEAIIMLGGMVGGFGDHYGRVAGAHAVHNGLTVLKETHHALHGEKVAYGILVQLVLENKWKEIDAILPFYRQLGIPLSLENLGVQQITEEKVRQVAEKTVVPEESIHLLPGEMTIETVSLAITELENYIHAVVS
ncbi:iron-containing alcohol dehydrogenase family protein [Niallia oryzisoli]|uniref:iron-containing alcohol dehydrogenase family protein n=1 Tax=Niallia oryzisoli TaxID=1737571 RepID=UPI0037350A72